MIIRCAERTWADNNIGIFFAIIPMRTSDGNLIWLESYYYYDNYQSIWRAPKKDFVDKEDFYNRIVGGK